MNQTFLRYNEAIVQSGLLQMNHGLAREVEEMTETFANCVKSSTERTLDSDEDEFGAEDTPPQQLKDNAVQTQPSATIPEKEQDWSYATTLSTLDRPRSEATAIQPESYLTHISSSSYAFPAPSNQSSVVRRLQLTVGEVMDQTRSMSMDHQTRAVDDRTQPQQQQCHRQDQTLPFGLVNLPSREESSFMPPYIFPVNVPAMGAELPPPPRHLPPKFSNSSTTSLITKTLSPDYTYSYEEVNFARRLLRATLEAGFLVLCSPDVHPAILEYIFKLSLPYLTLEEIRNRFKTILSRGVTEDLDWYATPFLHLGGAGTHYQRRDAQGRPIPMKNTWTIRQIGPLEERMIRMESVADGRTQDLEGIDLGGFEGEWFDSYDVQGYLEEQWHCRIDPRSSFAECLVDDENASPSDHETHCPSMSRGSTTSTSDNATPPASAPQAFEGFEPSYGLDMFFGNPPTANFVAPPPKRGLLDLSFDQTLGLDLAPGFDMGFAGSTGYSTLGLNTMGEAEQLPVVKQKPKRTAWVDVQKMIESKFNITCISHGRTILNQATALTKRAVCLGRAPGYRRKDVDAAFKEALIPAH